MVSIRDIARMAACSPASVSRILNNDANFSINDNTRKRVIEIANNLHYSKELGKKSPRLSNDSMSIGLILRHNEEVELRDPYFYEIHRGIELEAAKWRMRVINPFGLLDTEKNWDKLSQFGSIIVVGAMTDFGINLVKSKNKNVILVDNYQQYEGVDVIKTDFAGKTIEILNLLKHYGHEKIAFIGGHNSLVKPDGSVIRNDEEVRALSYRSWMKLNDLEKNINIKIGKWTAEDGMRMANEILEQKDLPTAIIVASDPMTMGVYRAISNAGLDIPNDISVISFDDVDRNKYLVPSLSSVRIKAREMGAVAVKLARDQMIDNDHIHMELTCVSDLKIRESLKKIK